MSTMSMSTVSGMYPSAWISIDELTQAVANKLLTQEEARLIVWSHFPQLQRAASITPPAIVDGKSA